MGVLIGAGNLLFGKGDDDFPIWLLAIRLNVLLLAASWAAILVWQVSKARWKRLSGAAPDVCLVVAVTGVAAAFRGFLVRSNLFDHGGIPYSRMLVGYKGYFATAQFFSLFYAMTSRSIEHAIFLDRVLSTITVPLTYGLCRTLLPQSIVFAAVTALLMALYPLQILFAASDVLSVFSVFLLTASYLLFVWATGTGQRNGAATTLLYLGAFLGLSLLTQVRYENALFLLPPAMYTVMQRRALSWRAAAPGFGVFLLFAAAYACWALTSGLAYQNAVKLEEGLAVARRDVLLNPLLSVPMLLAGTAVCLLRLPWGLKPMPLLVWVVASGLLILTADTGEHAARVYSNWLLFVLAFSGYGFSVVLTEAGWFGRAVGGACVLWLAAQPFLLREAFSTPYLEIVENDYFRSLWRELPDDVRFVVVPDDDVMNRTAHSSLETLTKYALIRAGAGAGANAAQVVGITTLLERPGQIDCSRRGCAFFFGLPCLERDLYPFAGNQCQELLRTHRTSVLDEATRVAAPFVDCSIYAGAMRQQLCDPATRPRRFAVYRIEE